MRAERRPPDVVGYDVEEARRILAAAGWPSGETSETRPPRRALSGTRRVVRQRVDPDGRIALVVCGERAADAPALRPAPLSPPGRGRTGSRRRPRPTGGAGGEDAPQGVRRV